MLSVIVTFTDPVYVPGVGLKVGVAARCKVNVAVTVVAAFIVIVHVVPEDVSHPPQLSNVDPLAALAVSVTTVPLS